MKVTNDSLLHIFTDGGNTYTFHNAKITVDNESVLEFEYKSASDNRSKKGSFLKKRIVGYSITQ